MITWRKLSTRTSVEQRDLNTQKGGMNTAQKVRIGTFCWIYPDRLVLVKEEERRCKIVDSSIPQHARDEQSLGEKFEKYQDLPREIRRICRAG